MIQKVPVHNICNVGTMGEKHLKTPEEDQLRTNERSVFKPHELMFDILVSIFFKVHILS